MPNIVDPNPHRPHQKYGAPAIAFHWILATLVLALMPLGLLLPWQSYPSPAYDTLHYWHRSVGEVALVVVLVSLIWRGRHPPPRHESDGWRTPAARWTQVLLYILLILLPVTKIMRGAFGLGWVFFGFSLPAPFAANKPISGVLSDAHDYAGFALIALAALHILAALWHRLVRRDQVMSRILP